MTGKTNGFSQIGKLPIVTDTLGEKNPAVEVCGMFWHYMNQTQCGTCDSRC